MIISYRPTRAGIYTTENLVEDGEVYIYKTHEQRSLINYFKRVGVDLYINGRLINERWWGCSDDYTFLGKYTVRIIR